MYDLKSTLKIYSAHMEVFVERYDKLLIIARSIARNDYDLARDIVHDSLVKFIRLKPDLRRIQNIDSYLCALVRNQFISQNKRDNIHSLSELAAENNDIFSCSLHVCLNQYSNPHLHIQMQDILRIVCEFACLCKEKLKLGSVLILRFIHGYHTSEIAEIMGVTAGAVSHQIKHAQAEVFSYLNHSNRSKFAADLDERRSELNLKYGCLSDDLVDELRRAVFQSTPRDAFTAHCNLNNLYGGHGRDDIDCKTLAHIVSCACCLDAVNALLGLELLSMRNPAEMLSRRSKAENDA